MSRRTTRLDLLTCVLPTSDSVRFARHLTPSQQWRRPSHSTPSALTFSIPTSNPTPMRISLYLTHKPDYFALLPEVAMLLDMAEGDRVSVLQALWGYVRMHGLVDEEQKSIRIDPRMRKVSFLRGFRGQGVTGLTLLDLGCSCLRGRRRFRSITFRNT